jgi:hypothetical protein
VPSERPRMAGNHLGWAMAPRRRGKALKRRTLLMDHGGIGKQFQEHVGGYMANKW